MTCPPPLRAVSDVEIFSKKKFFLIFLTSDPLGVILCGESIAHIPEPWKRFLDPDSGKESVYWSENRKFFGFLWENRRFLRFSRRRIDCAHSWTVKMLPWPWFRKGIDVLKRKSIGTTKQKNRKWREHFFEKKFLLKFSENHPIRGKIMRKINCAHSRSMKMLPWPWFRKIDVCIEAKIEKCWNFSLKIIFLGVISCGESIARIPKAWKYFLDPDSGKLVHIGFSGTTKQEQP